MEEEKQYWTVEDLESLTETVQEAEVKYQEKYIIPLIDLKLEKF